MIFARINALIRAYFISTVPSQNLLKSRLPELISAYNSQNILKIIVLSHFFGVFVFSFISHHTPKNCWVSIKSLQTKYFGKREALTEDELINKNEANLQWVNRLRWIMYHVVMLSVGEFLIHQRQIQALSPADLFNPA